MGLDLREDADVGPVDHVWLAEFKEGSVGVVAFKSANAFDILEFWDDEGAIPIAFSVDEGEHSMTVFPAIFRASQRGDSGRKQMPMKRRIAGIIGRPCGMRNAAVPLTFEQP